jgi:uncharacterized circularly permuted ATP-grasp superfamily protein
MRMRRGIRTAAHGSESLAWSLPLKDSDFPKQDRMSPSGGFLCHRFGSTSDQQGIRQADLPQNPEESDMLRDADNSMMAISATRRSSSRLEDNSSPVRDFQAIARRLQDDTASLQEVPVQTQRPAEPQVGVQFSEAEREQVRNGLRQRFEAISVCLDEALKTGQLPSVVRWSESLQQRFRKFLGPVLDGARPGRDWTWFASVDLHRSENGELTVMDQNFSVPTGLEFTAHESGPDAAQMRFFSGLSGYSSELRHTQTVILDPDFRGTTFRGNEFLAKCLNAHIARRTDLSVRTDGVFLQMGAREIPITTIIRRVEDELLDPDCYRPESLVGLPGLVRAWKRGLVQVLSPPGMQFANSRSFGAMMPTLIREVLGEDPVLNSTVALELSDESVLRTVLHNPEQYAIRTNDPQHPSRPFFGSDGKAAEFSDLLQRIHRDPTSYIARRLVASQENPGVSLRVFGAMNGDFRLFPRELVRPCQPDGGAPSQFVRA